MDKLEVTEIEIKSEDDYNLSGFALLVKESGLQYQIVGSSMFKSSFINKNGTLSKRFDSKVLKHNHSISHLRYENQIWIINEKTNRMSIDELKLINLKSRSDLISKIEADNLQNEFDMKLELDKNNVIDVKIY